MSTKELLTKLLDYIEEQAKEIDPRAFRPDLVGLPGVSFDINVEGDHLWLRVDEDALAFECATDALGQPLDERLQLPLTWGLNSPEHRWLGAEEISPVEHEDAEMNIQIERRAKPLDQRDGTRGARCAREPRLLKNVRRDRPIDDPEYLCLRLSVGCSWVFSIELTRPLEPFLEATGRPDGPITVASLKVSYGLIHLPRTGSNKSGSVSGVGSIEHGT